MSQEPLWMTANDQPTPKGPSKPSRVLVVEDDSSLGSLWARTIRTHVAGAATAMCGTSHEALDDGCGSADLVVCGSGESRRTWLATLERVMLGVAPRRVLLLAPAEAPDCIERALELGASDVLLKAPGYLEQLPLSVRLNLLLARRETERNSHLRELDAGVEELRRENRTLLTLVDRLKAAATTDPLTELSNRRGIEERLEQIVASASRHGSDVSVLMLDLDGLKQVNDLLGHQAGDEMLRCAGACIREQCRRGDVAGRAGGDEFIIALPHTPAERALVMAERVRARFQAAIAPVQARLNETSRAIGVVRVVGRGGKIDGTLGMTIGITSLATAGSGTVTGLIARADQALYSGKRAGKGRVVMFRTGIAGGLALAG